MQIPLNLKHVIQARYDERYINFHAYEITDDYSMDEGSIDHFAHEIPEQEWISVFDEHEDATAETYLRMQAALLMTGYRNARLVHAVYKYHPTLSRNLFNILSSKARDMLNFTCVYDGFDIRDIIAEAFLQVIRLLDGGDDFSFFQKKIDDFCKVLPNDKAVGSLARCIIKNGAKLDKLSHFIDKLSKDIREAEGDMYLEVTETTKSAKKYSRPIKGDEYYMDLESVYRPKMSSYMTRFWNQKGDRFFDVKTRKDFLEELVEYRTSIDELT